MKHFTLDDRIRIQRGLTINLSFTEIGKAIGKDRTSVSREVQAHGCGEGKPSRSKCKHRQECIFDDPSQCPAPSCPKRVCSIACAQCAKYCDRYEPEICIKLLKPPYVCNGCNDRGNGCHLDKRLYDAEIAHREYKQELSQSRSGISLSESELQTIEETVVPLIRNGVSLHVAYDAYSDRMPVSERTIYSYIEKSLGKYPNTNQNKTQLRNSNYEYRDTSHLY